jgi:ABC-type microcin C transport system duplicated ATPase subunit YejF
MSDNLLEISGLSVHYPGRAAWFFQKAAPKKAVDNISFVVPKGKTVGLVGESGSGKTTTGRAIVKLAPLTAGSIRYQGQDIGTLSNAAFLPWRKKIQMIFQDPYNSLNPRADILSILSEPLEIHFPAMSRADREARCAELLRSVQLPAEHLRRHPHEFSGGQRQRIGIARALAVELGLQFRPVTRSFAHMAMGTALTTGALAAIAVGAKGLAVHLLGEGSGRGAIVVRVLELAAALLVLFLGASLVLAAMIS